MFGITSARRYGLAITAAAAATLAAAALSAAPAASASAGLSRASTAHVAVAAPRYAVNRSMCPQATTPHTMSCYAMERVPVAKGTPNAYRLTMPSGLSARAVPAGCTGNDPIALGPAGGYTPADLAAAYGYNADAARAKQVIGIVDWYDDPDALQNLNTFDACYGLPKETSTSFRKVNQNGKTSPLPKKDADSGGEITLDIQSARAVCHTCRILLVEASAPSDSDLAIAENRAVSMGATEVSNSFGEPEQKVSSTVLKAYNHPGVVITASTGDHGWFGWDFANGNGAPPQQHASFPSTDPDVVSVGGTAIALNSDGTRGEEAVWNEDGVDDQAGLGDTSVKPGPEGATGGGCSSHYAARAWQADYPNYTKSKCGGHRLAADVSAIADPQTGFDIYDTFGEPGWITIGGTSLASPVTAAMFALAGGSGGAAYPASSLYVNAAQNPTSLFDVVPTNDGLASGNSFCGGDSTVNCGNFVSSTFGGTDNPNGLGAGKVDCSFPRNGASVTTAPTLDRECNTATGLDGPTGLGTPASVALFAPTSPVVTLTAPSTARKGASQTFKAAAQERLTTAHVTSYRFDFGDGHSSQSASPTAHHSFGKAGTYKVTLTVTDSLHQLVIETHKVAVH